jgi:tripartite-type tricarboxylate transporter receptor subunit TctC
MKGLLVSGVAEKCMLAAFALTYAGGQVLAQNYPDKPVRMVVPFAAGGGSDTTGRIVAQRLSELLGKNILVDNRAGAAGLIGTELAAHSPADGYTLLLADASHSSNPYVYRKATYDAIKDFAPISLVAVTPVMFCIHPSVPAHSIKEFIALARRAPNKLSYGSGGVGALGHLTGELFKSRTGIQIVHVPYKGGGLSVSDAIAGQITSVFVASTVSAPMVKAGKLRAIGVAAKTRSTVVPEVPTFEESGVPDFQVLNWFGVLAPAGTPAAIIARLHAEIAKTLQTQAVRDRFTSLLLDPTANTPDEFRALIEAEAARWSTLIKQAGIGAE